MATPGESLSRLAGFLSQQTARMEGRRERASERTEQRRRFEARMEAERLRAAEVEARFQAQAQESARRHGLGQEALAFETKQAGMKEATPETAAAYVARLRQMGDPEAMAPGTTEPTVIPPVGEPTWRHTETYEPEPRVGPPTPEEMGPGLAGRGPEGRMAEAARRRASAPMVRRPPEVVEEPNPPYEPGRTEAPTQPLLAGFLASYAGREKVAGAKAKTRKGELVGRVLSKAGMPALATEAIVEGAYPPSLEDIQAEEATKRQHELGVAALKGRGRGGARPQQIAEGKWRRMVEAGELKGALRSMPRYIPGSGGWSEDDRVEFVRRHRQAYEDARDARREAFAGNKAIAGINREIAALDRRAADPLKAFDQPFQLQTAKRKEALKARAEGIIKALGPATPSGYPPPPQEDLIPAGEGYDEPEEPIPPPQTMGPGGAQRSARPIPARVRRMLAGMTPQEQATAMAKLKAQGFEVPAGF